MRKEVLNSTVDMAMACAAEGIDRVFITCTGPDGDKLAYEVLHVVTNRREVLVMGCYADEVGEVIPDTFDESGGCIRRISLDSVTAVLTPEEFNVWVACCGADADMLENAI